MARVEYSPSSTGLDRCKVARLIRGHRFFPLARARLAGRAFFCFIYLHGPSRAPVSHVTHDA